MYFTYTISTYFNKDMVFTIGILREEAERFLWTIFTWRMENKFMDVLWVVSDQEQVYVDNIHFVIVNFD